MARLPGISGDEQIFAIGDIHGQSETLAKALDDIALRKRSGAPTRLIFLGDIIDRGPGSLASLDLVQNAADLARVDHVTRLIGNHEIMFLAALEKPDPNMKYWLRSGGFAMAAEILGHDTGFPDSYQGIADLIKERIPEEIKLISTFEDNHKSGDLLFVHGGIAPFLDIDAFLAQDRFHGAGLGLGPSGFEDHWAWIRDDFLYHEDGWGDEKRLVVVHGHSPGNYGKKLQADDDLTAFDLVDSHRRINLDAGSSAHDQAILFEYERDQYRLDLVQAEPYDPALEDPMGFLRGL